MARKAKILLVDDDLRVSQALGEALQGFAENQIDVALLDVHLGTENGWDVFRDLTALQPHLPVLVMSGDEDHTLGPAPATASVTRLEKPLDLHLLFQKL